MSGKPNGGAAERQRISLHIDSLIVHGSGDIDPSLLVAALERELVARLSEMPALRARLSSHAHGAFSHVGQADSTTLGRNVAVALADIIQREGAGNG